MLQEFVCSPCPGAMLILCIITVLVCVLQSKHQFVDVLGRIFFNYLATLYVYVIYLDNIWVYFVCVRCGYVGTHMLLGMCTSGGTLSESTLWDGIKLESLGSHAFYLQSHFTSSWFCFLEAGSFYVSRVPLHFTV